MKTLPTHQFDRLSGTYNFRVADNGKFVTITMPLISEIDPWELLFISGGVARENNLSIQVERYKGKAEISEASFALPAEEIGQRIMPITIARGLREGCDGVKPVFPKSILANCQKLGLPTENIYTYVEPKGKTKGYVGIRIPLNSTKDEKENYLDEVRIIIQAEIAKMLKATAIKEHNIEPLNLIIGYFPKDKAEIKFRLPEDLLTALAQSNAGNLLQQGLRAIKSQAKSLHKSRNN